MNTSDKSLKSSKSIFGTYLDEVLKQFSLTLVFLFLGFAQAYSFQPDKQLFIWDALSPQYLYRHFTTEDGLPVNSISDILPHSDGFVYVATFDGLARFDGVRFVVFNTANSPALKRNRISKMMEAPNGNLWLLDTSQNFYEFKNNSFTYLNDQLGSENPRVFDIRQSHDGTLHLLTEKGNFKVLADQRFQQMDSISYKSPEAISKLNMREVSNPTGSQKIVSAADLPFSVSDSLATGKIDAEGNIWYRTTGDGIYEASKKKMLTIGLAAHPGLTNIYGLYEDAQNAIWINAFNDGIFRIQDSTLTMWNPKNETLPEVSTRTIVTLRNGATYAGGTGGIWKLENNAWIKPSIFKDAFQGVDVLYEDSKTRFWIGTNRGLFQLRENHVERFVDQYGVSINQTKYITEFYDQGLLFATSGQGVALLNTSNNFSFITTEQGLSSNQIRDIYVQSKDTLWVASEDLGLNRVVLNDNFTVHSIAIINSKDGLIDNSLHRLLGDDFGYFWINSNKGIMRINKENLNAYADGTQHVLNIQQFSSKNELLKSEGNGGIQYSGLITEDGKLLFSNQAGIVFTRPEWHLESINNSLAAPIVESIVFSDSIVSILGKPSFKLPASSRDFKIKFTLPTFIQPDNLILEYKLEGVNKAWQKTGADRFAVFTNVPGGKHSFLMRGRLTGNAEYSESSMQVTVPYKFQETIWFYLLISFLGFGLLVVGFKFRVHALYERQRKLQQLVDEKTHELKKAAEEKTRFFTGITHELKTPLSLIISPIDDLIEESKSGTLHSTSSKLPLIQRNSYRLKNLVDQLLDVSKLNAHAIKLKVQPVNLFQFTCQVIGQFQSRLEQEEISIEISTIEFPEFIYVDKEAWERIVINLMSNAIKFSPKGSSISISFIEKEKIVEITIEDEGKGVALENQDKIFNYLYQEEGDNAAEGTGIGLFLVKGLMEEMGGFVSLNSKPGEGAKFIITLQKGYAHINVKHTLLHEPLLNDDKMFIEKIEHSSEMPKMQNSTQEQQILVVEDNYDFRSYLQSILEGHYKVLTAMNGIEALKILDKEMPDLIISDIMMPEMNGLEFVNSLRTKKQYQHLPIIFLSAKNDDLDVQTGLSTGADVYLAKPIRSSMLLAQITAILRRERILKNGLIDSVSEEEEPDFRRKVREIIFRQLSNPSLSVSQLADALYISRSKLYAEWKKISEVSVNDFIKKTRLNEAKVLLKEKGFTVQEAARAVGYADANYFSTSFKKEFGYPPSELMK